MCRLPGLARAVGVPLLLTIGASLELSAQSGSSTPPTGMLANYVEIDGKKSPERIPDYMVWRKPSSLAELDIPQSDGALGVDLPLDAREET